MLDFFQARVDDIHHAVQELSSACVLIIVAYHIEFVIFCFGFPSEHNLKRVEYFGLFQMVFYIYASKLPRLL